MVTLRAFIFFYAVSCGVDIVSADNRTILSQADEEWPFIGANRTDELFPNRIVGGFQASIRQNCWQVALFENGDFTCGGVILGRFWVLTAAHCIHPKRSYAVRAGSRFFRHGGQVRRVRISVVKGGFANRPFKNDVAMLRLSKPLSFNIKVCKVKVATLKGHLRKHFLITGWGVTRFGTRQVPSALRATNVELVSKKKCSRAYNGNVPNEVICAAAAGKDTCLSESGGPLTHGGVLYGIVSIRRGCTNTKYPGIYLDVRYQRKWINNVIKRYG